MTVMQWERVVRFVDGELVDVLGPGRHRYRAGRTRMVRLDTRPSMLTVPGQELLTSDGLTLKVSVQARSRIADPVRYLTESERPNAEVYAAVQTAIRDAVAAVTLEEALADRTALSAGLTDTVEPVAERVGLVVSDAAVKDLMLSGEVRRALADAVLAKAKGRAELERARAEAAVLRSMANTARLLREHPELLHLRTLQAAAEPGTTVVLTPPQH
jgi:regulator of protease activity HflC (stomatin/prohibitin superfamily)